jgi:type VI secretion system protein
MPLEVKVISYRGHPPVENLKASFGQDGGTLGRLPDKRHNHLTLPDPEHYISRSHASITFENGLYYLTDTSVDGTFINDRRQRVNRETVSLADGDQIWIGEYELRVHITSNGTHETAADDIFQFHGERASFSDMGQGNRARTVSPGNQESLENKTDWWPDSGFLEKSAEPGKIILNQPEESPLRDAFSPPDIEENPSQSRAIPKDFNFEQLLHEMDEPHGNRIAPDAILTSESDPTTGPDTPGQGFETPFFSERGESPASTGKAQAGIAPTAGKVPEAETPPDSTSIAQLRQQAQLELFRIFLNAAGVKETTLPHPSDMPEVMASIGAVFREMVNGLMAILRGRTELKTQLRVQATLIKPEDNNPLKFFGELDEALRQLLVGDQPGFVDALSAVRDGFADIMNHQMAMTAGLQAALIKLIERFDPQGFAKQYEDGVVFQKKAKSWDAYQQAYTKIANEALDDCFGKPFADAYEAQIRKLQSKPK